MKTLITIGCGKLGKTLTHLWADTHATEIGDIFNRSIEAANQSVSFIGAGKAISLLQHLSHADIFLISTPDDDIRSCCDHLVELGKIKKGDIVFHCSGSKPSALLKSAQDSGAYIASVHPIKSFHDPDSAVQTFKGTFCGMEGDEEALDVLQDMFTKIGGKAFTLDASKKTIYHAANVLVCNNLVALMECGIQAFEESGIPRDRALQIMEPIVKRTVDNIFNTGTEAALTGPVVRGDVSVVREHQSALEDFDPRSAEVYQSLGRYALQLSRQVGKAKTQSLDDIESILLK